MIDISETEKRYLLSLLGIFLLSLYLSLNKNKILHIPASIIVLCIAYDIQSLVILSTVTIASFTILMLCYNYRHIAHILMFINLACIITYKFVMKQTAIDICAPIMIFTIKYYYLGKEYKNNANIKDCLIYLFQLPGIMTGPVQSYNNYLKNEKIKNFNKGLIIVFQSLLFLFVYSILRTKFDLEDIADQSNISIRVICLIIFTTVIKCKYYFVWTFAYGCFAITGVDNMKNVFPINAEFSSSIKELQQSWNIYTNAWLKESVFLPLKKYGFYKASLATFFVSAIWHGTNPCYFIMFLTFSLCVPLLNNNNKIIKSLFRPSIAYFFCILQMMLFANFFSLPFFLLDYQKLFVVWQSLYFYGYAMIGASLLLFLYCHSTKKRTNEN
ncbi:Lysophospholipid acyltransferase [Binucleata daphniae]